jgi:hypothetical protein
MKISIECSEVVRVQKNICTEQQGQANTDQCVKFSCLAPTAYKSLLHIYLGPFDLDGESSQELGRFYPMAEGHLRAHHKLFAPKRILTSIMAFEQRFLGHILGVAGDKGMIGAFAHSAQQPAPASSSPACS